MQNPVQPIGSREQGNFKFCASCMDRILIGGNRERFTKVD